MLELVSSYPSKGNADRTVEGLLAAGFDRSTMALQAPGADGSHWSVRVRPPFGMGLEATQIMDRFTPVSTVRIHEPDTGVDHLLISRLSGPVDPGAITRLSGRKSPGAISALSGRRSPGAIAKLSGRKAPGAIARLSGPKAPGAIAALSRTKSVGAIRRLSAGWHFSRLLGLPLLTRSQKPSEPDSKLLTKDQDAARQVRLAMR